MSLATELPNSSSSLPDGALILLRWPLKCLGFGAFGAIFFLWIGGAGADLPETTLFKLGLTTFLGLIGCWSIGAARSLKRRPVEF
ncbi:hypothetical protein [Roseivivax sp. THAF30]|jgi:hypothetical protein|uniref:hypothetical protein n=1 Tax=Roseivivax sp. THAF30 TaxID=2587852 RepID=UPI001267B8C9|nr:hypothetical protein [Roseivivax sp. THAF30]QFT63404.1 hypothetical protein FIU91_10750 [Roseivivax sp. THAF30]